MDDAGEAADDHVADALAVERREELVGVERAAACSSTALELFEERLDALLRRLLHARLELGVELRRRRELDDRDVEREAAGLDDGDEVREARLLAADLPAGDLSPLASEARGEFRSASVLPSGAPRG